ncbi:MAG: lysine--tRNA ligase [Actinomycetota bacterium]|nr:lysine--tRNA ligase [Actinomycetota bacterium]
MSDESTVPILDWARRVADHLGGGPHVVVTGISTSGHIHVGNLREVLVGEAVADVLRERGEEVRFIFHADTIDPLRKIAPGVPENFKEFMGHSLSRVPDPEGCHISYAEHFLAPFEEALDEMGMDIEVLRSHELYENGVYTDVTREALEHAEGLRQILQEVTGRRMPEHWSPYLPREASGRLTGHRILEHVPEESKVVFEDEDGFEDAADYSKGEGKLGWRVELAARWKALGVTFEPFGKDHTSRGGSTDTADRMAEEIFHYPVPGRYEYEWIGIKGKGDMSSSRGIVLLPKDLLMIMPPDALRRMVLGRDPARRSDLELGEGFPRFMDEYRASVEENPVPFTHLVTVAQTVGADVDAAAHMLSRGGYEEAARDRERLARYLSCARNWAEGWAPESLRLRILDEGEAEEAAAGLDAEQREYLAAVAWELEQALDGDAVQDLLYSTAVGRGLKPKKAFAAVYTVLLGRKSGPKAGPFIAGLPVEVVRERFSL